ncbi:Biosynthetic arginine decarboxylase [Roseibaca ekhonensis]|jgi:arginine decarboxylase|uniref:Arginine decarboxylase n=1 Tax=Roseinatronobacter ekhonensis TaxID=254356 RepID=A0A3B0MH95_9RHOB|nr:biosynthetic arginine decarboxylase [Roseibaca ekhonensis]SUZ32878.1 Biosynthetic arginine decarboxylase [Roseibaca ekhonensis]
MPDRIFQQYGIHRWGAGMFARMENGDLGLVNPARPDDTPASLPELLHNLHARGVHTPVLVRVGAFLRRQLESLNHAFAAAIVSSGYQGTYRGVFPIKVNQQAEVIDRIVEYGRPFQFGLEAGSKPELILALSRDLPKGALLICNGIKDAEFIRLGILARKAGINCVLVIESPAEADTVIAEAKRLGEKPALGVRIKLTRRVTGNWADSSGDRSTFGLTTKEVVDLIDKLRDADMLDCLVLQHAHLGSQVPQIMDIRQAVDEACRFYTELRRLGVPLEYLDLGGGLGIDYTGEARASDNSVNYTLEEYCTNVVETVKYQMEEAEVPHPTLVTESGRAIVAYSSMLLSDILEASYFDRAAPLTPEDDDHHMLSDMAAISGYLTPRRVQECLNDADYYREELRAMFRRGVIGIEEVARAEQIFLYIVGRIKDLVAQHPADVPQEVVEALSAHRDIYRANFSLFQSLPDVWAIDQLVPIAPLQRLNEQPGRRAVLSDITCDSDGKIDQFVLGDGIGNALPIHELSPDERYFIGIFLVGAYQETLGDLHNLFGDTNIVTVDFNEDGVLELQHEVEGDTVSEVMAYVEYEPRQCLDAFKRIVERGVRDGTLNPSQRRMLMETYRHAMNGYTYYELEEHTHG